MLPMINWANVGIDPTLLGIQQGQNIFAQGQDAYRQGVMNRMMPDQLREALMAQQLANQHQGIVNENLPEKLREALLAQKIGNKQEQINLDFLPREKQLSLANTQSMMNSRGLGDQMTQLQINQLKQMGSPEAMALARRAEEARVAEMEERANMSRLKQKMATTGGGQISFDENGNMVATPGRKMQGRLEQGITALTKIYNTMDQIKRGKSLYAGYGQKPSQAWDTLVSNTFLKDYFPGSVLAQQAFYDASGAAEASAEDLATGMFWPNTNKSLEKADRYFNPYGGEAPEIYEKRMDKQKIKVGKILNYLIDLRSKGIPMSEEQLSAKIREIEEQETPSEKKLTEQGLAQAKKESTYKTPVAGRW